MTGADEVIAVRGLTFDHPGRALFARCDFAFAEGVTWLRGSNGRGKSTLLKLLAGALPAAEGEMRMGAIVESADPLGWRRAVHWVGADAPATRHLRAREYVAFVRGLHPGFDAGEAARQAEGFALGRAAMDRPIDQLSDGLRRKVALVAALAAGTRALLLDEPLDALDAAGQAHLRAVLGDARRWRGRAVVVASHVSPLADGAPPPAVVDLDAIVGD